jgi:K(+)-stimulated pyrophosphate-energized sodium pump
LVRETTDIHLGLDRFAIGTLVSPSLLPILVPVVLAYTMNWLMGPGAGICER